MIRRWIGLVEGIVPAQQALSQVYEEVDASGTVTEGIAAAERAWRGGIADFGDRAAASIITAMPGYNEYQMALSAALRRHFGQTMRVYRLMPRAAYVEQCEDPQPTAWATAVTPEGAAAFLRFAGHRGRADMVVVEIEIDTEFAPIMRGKIDEGELVIDPYEGLPLEDRSRIVREFGGSDPAPA